MNTSRAQALIPLAMASCLCMALGACKIPGMHGGKAPTGQVAATVNGQEVTIREIAAETTNVNTADPKARHDAEMAALNNILGRKILAQTAIDQGLDKTPDFALQKQRVIETLLAQTLQNKIAAQVPPATKEEAQSFITDHPDIFAQRKVYTVDQLRMPKPKDVSVLKAFEPMKTLPEVEAELTKDNLPYQKSVGAIDAVGADPKLIDEIAKLPPGEIFIVPSGGGLLVNQIRDTQVIPFTGPAATQYAMSLITRQRTQEAVQRQLHAIIGKAAGTVRFNKDYSPPKAAAAAPPPPAKAE